MSGSQINSLYKELIYSEHPNAMCYALLTAQG